MRRRFKMKKLNILLKGGILTIVSFMLIIFLINGCRKDSSVLGPTANNLSVGYYGDNNPGDNTLVIDVAKFIVSKLVINTTGGDSDNNIRIDPFVLNMDVNQRVIIAAITTIPIGSYSQLKFQMHKLNQNETVNDPEFVDSSYRWSVVVKGRFNGNAFVYKSGVTFDKNLGFSSPLLVSTTDVINVTVKLELYSWFWNNGDYLDPTLTANKSIIDAHIRDSFREVFKDNNRDGHPD